MVNPLLVENLFGIKGLNIAWYGVILCVGIIVGALVAKVLSKRRGYKFDMILDFLILALPLALICARIYYVAFEWERYAGDFLAMIAIWEGGIAIYGGIIGAVIAAIIFCKWKKIPLGDLLDIGAPGLIVGQAIGRWGNFVNQEAFGLPITNPSLQWFPYGVNIERAHTVFDESLQKVVSCAEPWHLATFFYESMWNVLVFVGLMLYWKHAKHKGNVFAAYLVMYGIGRLFIEGMRMDSLWLIPGVIRVSQLLSLILIVGGVLYILLMHKKTPKIYQYSGKYSLGTAVASEFSQDDDDGESDSDETSSEDSSDDFIDTEDDYDADDDKRNIEE